jgi:hypothetical protein
MTTLAVIRYLPTYNKRVCVLNKRKKKDIHTIHLPILVKIPIITAGQAQKSKAEEKPLRKKSIKSFQICQPQTILTLSIISTTPP